MMDAIKRVRLWLALGIPAVTLILVSCGGGSSSGGGGGSAGLATVQGSVASFSAQSAALENAPGVERLLFDLASLLSEPATAQTGVDDIRVSIGSRSTTTSGSGAFTLTSVPSGSQVINFSRGSSSASAPINVPPDSVVTIVVVVSGSNANINNMNVNGPGGGNDNTPGGNTNAPGANTNTGGGNTNTDGGNTNTGDNTNDDDDDNDNGGGNRGRG